MKMSKQMSIQRDVLVGVKYNTVC